jgi:xanthosine utilization system XapX-like protein
MNRLIFNATLIGLLVCAGFNLGLVQSFAQVQAPAPAQARDKVSYGVAGLQLGSNVIGSAEYREYSCAPTTQYAGFTGCQRRTTERSRRRRISTSTSFLQATDGSVVYISQNIEPVAINEDDARNEIARLSETLGKATLLPIQNSRGAPSGLIVSWGAVSLQPLSPARVEDIAAGVYAQPDLLIDTVGNLQRSARSGLPIYRMGGGAGYVWSINWINRRRAALRVVAVDVSRLPGGSVSTPQAVNAPPPATDAASATAAAARPSSDPTEAAKPATTPQTVPTIAAQPAQTSAGLEPRGTAAANKPADVRVVGPPVAVRPAASAASPTPVSQSSASGNGLVTFLIALVIGLLGVIVYLLRKSRAKPPTIPAEVSADEPAKHPPTNPPEEPVVPKSEKMDLTSLAPAEPPVSLSANASQSKS